MKGFESGFGGGEHSRSATVEAEPQSPLLTEPNFKKMCMGADTTPQIVLGLLAEAGETGREIREKLQEQLTTYTGLLSAQKGIADGDILAKGRVTLQRARIEDEVLGLIKSIVSHAE